MLGIVVQDVDGLVGINCDPITVGKSCSNTPVCCEDNAIVSTRACHVRVDNVLTVMLVF